MDQSWDMSPFHNPLNVSLLKVIHKLHIRLNAHVISMKLVVPKVPKEVGIERGAVGGWSNWSLSCCHIWKKKEKEREDGIKRKEKKEKEKSKKEREREEKNKIMLKDDIRCLDGLKNERQSMQN